MTDEEIIEASRITPEQAKATSEAIMAMYREGDHREYMLVTYKARMIEAGYLDELKDTAIYGTVVDVFFGIPMEQLETIMNLSPNEIANRYNRDMAGWQ